ncbi:hypothetical protein [Sphingopyxis sp.]|uniref:hypothetical protein n=1 Tax=Sphingopyxis sp. TaxID=1908224 RepID=UPI003D1134E1
MTSAIARRRPVTLALSFRNIQPHPAIFNPLPQTNERRLDPLDHDGRLHTARLIDHCRANLSHLKCPCSFDFDPALPRHETGKLYKQAIRKRCWS